MSHVRRAARVLLVDDDDRVLLLWHEAPHDDHWAPPGGGIEVGESPEVAAARELLEEVGLSGVTLGLPVHLWTHRFRYAGGDVEQHETIYLSRISTFAPAGSAPHLSIDGITAWRWWTLDELAVCTDDVWPDGLVDLLRRTLRTSRGSPDVPG
jgi:8-oxo-dGTP pyrophosphatase MutT (NUDIX family)